MPDPSERWTTAIALLGQIDARVERLDLGIVPARDVALEDVGERRPVEDELARLDALEIHDRHRAAHDHRELDETGCFQVVRLEGHVGGAEGHGLGLDLLDAAARADRLIVQADAGHASYRRQPIWNRSDRGTSRRPPIYPLPGRSSKRVPQTARLRESVSYPFPSDLPPRMAIAGALSAGRDRPTRPVQRNSMCGGGQTCCRYVK